MLGGSISHKEHLAHLNWISLHLVKINVYTVGRRWPLDRFPISCFFQLENYKRPSEDFSPKVNNRQQAGAEWEDSPLSLQMWPTLYRRPLT